MRWPFRRSTISQRIQEFREYYAHSMADEAVHRRQELRRSNAAVPHRNRHRERKTGKTNDTTVCYCGQADCDECMSWDRP